MASPDLVRFCEGVEALEMLRKPDVGQLKLERYNEQEGTAASDRCVSKYGVGILLAYNRSEINYFHSSQLSTILVQTTVTLTARWLIYVQYLANSTFCPDIVFMCFVWI